MKNNKTAVLGCLSLLLGFAGCGIILAQSGRLVERERQIEASAEYRTRIDNLRQSLMTDAPNLIVDVKVLENGTLLVTVSDGWYMLADYQRNRLGEGIARQFATIRAGVNLNSRQTVRIQDRLGKTLGRF